MKTKINFTVDSREITKQITATVTAEATHEAREIAKKQFAAALDEKIKGLIKNIDKDVKQDYWHNSETRSVLISAFKDAIDACYKENKDTIQKIAESLVKNYIAEIRDEYASALIKIDDVIKKQVKKQVEEYMQSAILKAIFSKADDGK